MSALGAIAGVGQVADLLAGPRPPPGMNRYRGDGQRMGRSGQWESTGQTVMIDASSLAEAQAYADQMIWFKKSSPLFGWLGGLVIAAVISLAWSKGGALAVRGDSGPSGSSGA